MYMICIYYVNTVYSLTGPAVLWRSLVCSLNEHDRTVASEAHFCFLIAIVIRDINIVGFFSHDR